jgi:heme/copper-type cytochrome/quinol oxidase subunit 2
MDYKAISKTLLIVAIVVVIAVAAVAVWLFVLQPPPSPKATIDLYIGATPGAPKEGDAAQLYLIVTVTPANQKFSVGDYVKIVLHNNNTWPNPHAFSINVGGVSVTTISASVGKTAEITIRLDKAGVYTATCTTFCGAWHTTTDKMVNVVLFEVS